MPTNPPQPASPLTPFREREFWFVIALAIGIYAGRMTLLPPCGEETRVATMAQEMIARGDFVVPRQQGTPFPERPPLGAWCMALVGMLHGEVDRVAIRLPSAIAVVLTCAIIYFYARSFLTPLGALASAAAYATFGQVMQIGRHGESEPLFALFVGASLFAWHLGIMRGWPLLACWSAGYALAAIGALAKGPQAPIYFVAATGGYLLLTRQWRKLICWQHAAGVALFAGIVAIWLIPFYFATSAEAVADIWMLLAKKRFGAVGILEHLALFPLETLACLLPWSLFLLHFGSKSFRAALAPIWPQVTFLLVAVAATYPSVLFAAGARGRYYMPMYPCLAVLIGVTIQYSISSAANTFAHRGWRRFLFAGSLIAATVAIAVVGLAALDAAGVPLRGAALLVQPVVWTVIIALVASGAAVALTRARRVAGVKATSALMALAVLVGVIYTGVVLNLRANEANDLAAAVAKAKAQLPDPGRLVSLGPIAHQFAYEYGEITEQPWPVSLDEVDPKLDYFCFHRGPSDDDETRLTGRGMKHTRMPARLPFPYEELARINFSRRAKDNDHYVVIARALPGLRTAQKP